MKLTINNRTVDAHSILIDIPVRYTDEDIPYNFPCRNNPSETPYTDTDRISLLVQVDTGEILTPEFPKEGVYKINSMKVCDEGVYVLYDQLGAELGRVEFYVPYCLPNEWGDYITLDIQDRVILNWCATAENIQESFFG